jgi:hypothetical protein
MDELKKYLQRNAEKLDLDDPGEALWEQIRGGIPVAKKAPVIMLVTRWAVAACVLVLAGIGTWTVLKNDKITDQPANTVAQTTQQPTNTQPVNPKPGTETQPVDKEVTANNTTDNTLAKAEKTLRHAKSSQPAKQPSNNSAASLRMLNEVETSFTQVINLQRARVSTTPMYAETPAYFGDFKVQIKQMERDEKQIKAEISKRGLNDELLDQLINLYQQKLNTLKQLQIEMNKTNNRFKQNRGPVDSTHTYFLNI